MQRGEDEIAEMQAELIALLFKKIKEYFEEKKEEEPTLNKDELKELFDEFKKEHADKFQQVKELDPEGKYPMDKDFILKKTIESVNEYVNKFDRSTDKSIEMINEIKETIDPSNKELLEKIGGLEKGNIDKVDDRNELMDSLKGLYKDYINENDKRIPSNSIIIDKIENDVDLNNAKLNKFENGNLEFTDDEGSLLKVEVNEEEKTVKLFKETKNELEDLSSTGDYYKSYTFDEMNSSSLSAEDNFIEKDGEWIKEETLSEEVFNKDYIIEKDRPNLSGKAKPEMNTKERPNLGKRINKGKENTVEVDKTITTTSNNKEKREEEKERTQEKEEELEYEM